LLGLLAIAMAVVFVPTAHGQSVEQFYAGKQGKLLIGGAAGGGRDFYGRLDRPFRSRHLQSPRLC
jgi:hypothetical protein